ncbi:MAG: hypothetical protein KDJ36_09720 [Hyphomicrobiaceae bacterium]|nr:hypothetical protein [Hyphomicrobiaceae bacterium]
MTEQAGQPRRDGAHASRTIWSRFRDLRWLHGAAPKRDREETLYLRRMLAISLIVVIASFTYFFLTFPATLRIAVGPKGSEFVQYARAISAALKEAEAPFRLRVVETAGSRESAAMLDGRRVPLALLRSDDETSKRARSLVVAHKRALIMLARAADDKVQFLSLLTSKQGALLIRDADSDTASVKQLLDHFGIKQSDHPLKPVDGPGAIAAFRSGQIDYLLVLANPADEAIRRLALDLRAVVGAAFKVLGPPGAKGLSERLDAFDSFEIPAGVFGGMPPLPSEDTKTVAVTYELVARSGLGERRAGLLTKALMEIRPLLRSPDYRGLKIEAPDTDAIRRYQPHVGAVMQLNGELQTIFEEYSDAIWLVLLFAGGIASAITGALGWLGFKWPGRSSRRTARSG